MIMQLNRYRGICGCGREHGITTKEVIIEKGAAAMLPGLAERLGMPKRFTAVCDCNTKGIAEDVISGMADLLHPLRPVIVLNSDGLHADEQAVGKVLAQLPIDTGWLLAVGSGTITDTVRYAAYERGLPYISFPTAASVDGFLSIVCAMTWNGYKITTFGDAPAAVLADTDVFAKAPYRLTASGAADVLGKYTALADWKIANLLIGEDYCARIAEMEREAVDNVRAALPGIKAGDESAMEALMYALLLSGLAMQMWGNSRPASCSEHHIAHFWEMGVITPQTQALHGEKVGVALCGLLPLYNRLAGEKDWARHTFPYKGFPAGLLREKFGKLYPDVEKANTPDPMIALSPEGIAAQEKGIRAILAEMPDSAQLKEEMDKAGITTQPEQIGLDNAVMAPSKYLAPFVRERISLLRVCNLMTDFVPSAGLRF
ncbi:MAG: sn-glycerol-1-phosphate dehydrogenase [Oscillospiraceae bacterium]|nr:sn-glycerol-1-phosphate dehydrogenase [Oscillospiraceae bacterium]